MNMTLTNEAEAKSVTSKYKDGVNVCANLYNFVESLNSGRRRSVFKIEVELRKLVQFL